MASAGLDSSGLAGESGAAGSCGGEGDGGSAGVGEGLGEICATAGLPLPKARLVGVAVSAPGATPVPERGILRLGLDPLEVMVTLPLAAPAVVGANFTENDVL